MKTKQLLLCVMAAALPALAASQEAHSIKAVNLRAGPARDYPLVASLGPGTPLAVTIGDSFSASIVPHVYHFTTVAERALTLGPIIANIGVAAKPTPAGGVRA